MTTSLREELLDDLLKHMRQLNALDQFLEELHLKPSDMLSAANRVIDHIEKNGHGQDAK